MSLPLFIIDLFAWPLVIPFIFLYYGFAAPAELGAESGAAVAEASAVTESTALLPVPLVTASRSVSPMMGMMEISGSVDSLPAVNIARAASPIGMWEFVDSTESASLSTTSSSLNNVGNAIIRGGQIVGQSSQSFSDGTEGIFSEYVFGSIETIRHISL